MNIDGFIRSTGSFSEFFEKAKTLSNKERGDAFERVVQLYLRSASEYRSFLDDVWQLKEVPQNVAKYLNLPSTDEGIDLIARANDGTYWAVQAKYRSNPNYRLTWGGKGGLSTFIALAFNTCENISFGLVCSTTTKELSKTHLTGHNIGFALIDKFKALDEGGGWLHLKSGLNAEPQAPAPYEPLPHQQRAIHRARHYFHGSGCSRGKLIMPCGTGKSLTGYWIANELEAQEILVAVPSLSLIRQTLNVWTREFLANNLKPRWIAVCSDVSAGEIDEDEFTAETYDLGIPCVTDIEKIAEFLGNDCDTHRVVFTTYQSGEVLAAASKRASHRFDLGIMDEAHKTTGKKDNLFSYLLYDENIKISQRVFMTATERFYRGWSDEIASMDDASLYGETFELLTFKEAIEEYKIICDYQFVTIGVSELEIRHFWEDNTYLHIEGTELTEETTRSLASGLALRKAFGEYGINRAISFHKSILEAKLFAKQQEKLEPIFPELKHVDVFHVSSETHSGDRVKQLERFGKAPRALISNARCLTEGVDIPSVDCVLFSNPRKSKVDIVQAAGRALRKSKGKKLGYIIVPIVVPDDVVDLDSFAKGTAFSEVISTVIALASQDERIYETFSAIQAGGVPSGSNIKIDSSTILSTKISASDLEEAVGLRIWERVRRLAAKKLDVDTIIEWVVHEYSETGDYPNQSSGEVKKEPTENWGLINTCLVQGRRGLPGGSSLNKLVVEYFKAAELRLLPKTAELVSLREIAIDYGLKSVARYEEKGFIKSVGKSLIRSGDVVDVFPIKQLVPLLEKIGIELLFEGSDHVKFAELGVQLVSPAKYKSQAAAQKILGRAPWLFVEAGRLQVAGRGFSKGGISKFFLKADVEKLAEELKNEDVKKEGLLTGQDVKDRFNLKNISSLHQSGRIRPDAFYQRGKKTFPLFKAETIESYLGKETLGDVSGLETSTALAKKLGISRSKFIQLADKQGIEPKGIKRSQGRLSSYYSPGCVDQLLKIIEEALQEENLKTEILSFEEARDWVRGQNYKSVNEMRQAMKQDDWPENIPKSPNVVYKKKWIDFYDFLGSAKPEKFLRFEEARNFARSLEFTREDDWRKYCRSGDKPQNIPASPNSVYKNKGWTGMKDWLGINDPSAIKILSYDRAKAAIQTTGCSSAAAFSKLRDKGKIPAGVPSDPVGYFKRRDEWLGWGDFLGTGRHMGRWRPFVKAREFVRNLNLTRQKDWCDYASGKIEETHGKRPSDIPSNPAKAYPKEWVSMGDWLGTSNVAPQEKKFREFKKAREFVRALNFKTQAQWRNYSSGKVDQLPEEYQHLSSRPEDIPAAPDKLPQYQDEWVSWGDWLGKD